MANSSYQSQSFQFYMDSIKLAQSFWDIQLNWQKRCFESFFQQYSLDIENPFSPYIKNFFNIYNDACQFTKESFLKCNEIIQGMISQGLFTNESFLHDIQKTKTYEELLSLHQKWSTYYSEESQNMVEASQKFFDEFQAFICGFMKDEKKDV